ncbi:MAG: ABC transporter permease [Solirubrobacterales bacterium]|nr:ABC transporter permease [Solirubrobacterales bacterium]
MIRYIIRRLLWAVVMLWVVSFVTFVVFYLLPTAEPAALRAGKNPTPALIASIRHSLGLDKPWYQQYLHYMERLFLHFDFGYSYHYNIAVKQQIFERLPATISLVLGAAVIWIAVGVGVGVISAVRRGTLLDRATMGAALVAISAPVYWLGLLALFLFASDIGKVAHIFPGAGSYVPLSEDPVKWFTSLILPWLVLAASFAAIYARLLRANLIEVLSEDYIRTARAKGLSERRVTRHGLRGAITPIVSAAGVDIGVALGGVILVETVFNIPGVGRLAYESIINADLPMIQGTVLVGAFFIVFANLTVDILYAFIDPRVRYT